MHEILFAKKGQLLVILRIHVFLNYCSRVKLKSLMYTKGKRVDKTSPRLTPCSTGNHLDCVWFTTIALEGSTLQSWRIDNSCPFIPMLKCLTRSPCLHTVSKTLVLYYDKQCNVSGMGPRFSWKPCCCVQRSTPELIKCYFMRLLKTLSNILVKQ